MHPITELFIKSGLSPELFFTHSYHLLTAFPYDQVEIAKNEIKTYVLSHLQSREMRYTVESYFCCKEIGSKVHTVNSLLTPGVVPVFGCLIPAKMLYKHASDACCPVCLTTAEPKPGPCVLRVPSPAPSLEIQYNGQTTVFMGTVIHTVYSVTNPAKQDFSKHRMEFREVKR